jgi:hypothetical protein
VAPAVEVDDADREVLEVAGRLEEAVQVGEGIVAARTPPRRTRLHAKGCG